METVFPEERRQRHHSEEAKAAQEKEDNHSAPRVGNRRRSSGVSPQGLSPGRS